jgi:cupin fold WbuC family metalloprotein
MKQIATSQLSELARAAQESPRRRANLNLHESLSDPIQRLVIAMEPDTLIRPHRHPQTWELLIPLRGRFIVLHFDDAGVMTDRVVLGDEIAVMETPAGQWHAVLSLDEGGVIFEAKHGPYTPISNGNFAHWGSGEGETLVAALLSWYESARLGDRFVGV